MKKILLSLFIAFSLSVFSQNQDNFVNNHLIIKLSKDAYKNASIDLAENHFGINSLDSINERWKIASLKSIGKYNITRTFLLVFKENINVTLLKSVYDLSGLTDYAEPDYIASGGGKKKENAVLETPNDTHFFRQWGFVNSGTLTGVGETVVDADVDMDEAWDIETGDPDMIIAISDSGLKLNHPDIASRVWVNANEIANNGIDDDENGFIDDVNGWDWVNDDNQPSDDLGHGTNIASIIGAIPNNSSLYTGANWNSKLMILKSLNSDNGANISDMANSVYYAADNGAKVFSMSIGGGYTLTMADAVSYANDVNMIFVACMMNFNSNVAYYPAAYSTSFPNVIAVGATNPDDSRTVPFFWSATSGSSYGAHINVVAPGNYIYGLSHTSNAASTVYWGGTSQATPLVAAIASLLLSYDPSLTPLEIRTLLEETAADQVGTTSEDVVGFDNYMGYGRVNANDALLALQAMLDVKDVSVNKEISVINPVKNNALRILCNEQFSGQYKITIFDMLGKSLCNTVFEVSSEGNDFPFYYPKGNYIVKVESDAYKKIFKVIKK